MSPTVIHVSPHPDDESIAAPCALLTLRDQGWRVINYAASLGRPGDHDRRRAELRTALGVAGFEHREALQDTLVANRPGISGRDDHRVACGALTGDLRRLVAETDADLVVGPHPRDGHHGHATVARAVRQVVWTSPRPLRWWMWSVWSDLPRPTVVVSCSDGHRRESAQMLEAYEGENGRNDYRRMQDPMRLVNAVRGVEKAFGYGSCPGSAVGEVSHAELLTEVTQVEKRWMVGRARLLDPAAPVPPGPKQATPSEDWSPLDDMTILSAAKLRPLYHPKLMSMLSAAGPATIFSRAAMTVEDWTSGGALGWRSFRLQSPGRGARRESRRRA